MQSSVSEQLDEGWARRVVLGGVLIGGGSTRMGQVKSLLRYQGQTFVEVVIEVLRERTERVVLLGEGQIPVVSPEIARVPDPPGLAGPLAGILAALRWQRDACWILVACDLPLLRVEAIDWLLEQRRPSRWAVLPKVDHARVEPLLAVYEPESLELLEEVVASGRRCPRHIASHPAVHTPTPPPDLHACWTNINRPEDLDRLGP
jgi:molybdopterin-guanine dinucleotide biosynthesis protein A